MMIIFIFWHGIIVFGNSFWLSDSIFVFYNYSFRWWLKATQLVRVKRFIFLSILFQILPFMLLPFSAPFMGRAGKGRRGKCSVRSIFFFLSWTWWRGAPPGPPPFTWTLSFQLGAIKRFWFGQISRGGVTPGRFFLTLFFSSGFHLCWEGSHW